MRMVVFRRGDHKSEEMWARLCTYMYKEFEQTTELFPAEIRLEHWRRFIERNYGADITEGGGGWQVITMDEDLALLILLKANSSQSKKIILL